MSQADQVGSRNSTGSHAKGLLDQAIWAWQYAWAANPRLLIGLAVGSTIASALPAGLAWAGRGLINAVTAIATQDLGEIQPAVPWLLLAFGLAALQEAIKTLSDYLRTRLDHQLQYNVTSDMLSHAAKLDVSWFEDPDFQDVAERAQQNTAARLSEFIDKTMRLGTDLIQLGALAAVLLVVDWLAVVIMVSLAIPYVIYRWRHARDRFNKEYSRATKRRWTRYFVSMLTTRASVAEIKISNLAPHLIERYRSLSREFLDEDLRLQRRDVLATTAFSVVYLLVFYALFARITSRVAFADLSVGDVALFAAVITRSRQILDSVARAASGALEETLYISNLAEFFRVRPRLPDEGFVALIPEPAGVEFQNISFTYPGSGHRALTDVTLRVHPGETLALVGENGAGKTTLVKLLARFYDPDEGSILFSGVDLRDAPISQLHRQIAFVFQNFNRYEALVWENIAYGNANELLTQEDARAVADAAGLDAWIQTLPQGYATMLGRRFGEYDLSAGQWQRLAVARALARTQASLLILDEPTASLDARAEYDLFLRFRELAAGRTTILISHRFSTVGMADRIAVLDQGRIVETGTHDQLITLAGKYAMLYDLHRRQMQTEPESSQ